MAAGSGSYWSSHWGTFIQRRTGQRKNTKHVPEFLMRCEALHQVCNLLTRLFKK
jgi:hypothetical protein